MNTKHGSITQLSLVMVVTILVALCAVQEAAVAAPITGPFKDGMEGGIDAGAEKGAGTSSSIAAVVGSNIKLPGGSPQNKQVEGEGTKKPEFDAGANEFTYDQLTLAPLKGFRQLAGAEPIQEMYKDLISKPVPVLFQTMMMVENGAATGFIGSMNAVSGLMSNTVETSELSMRLMDMTQVSDQLKYAYVGKLRQAFESKEADSWPAALYIASGDAAKGNLGEFKKLPDKTKAFDFADHPMIKAAKDKLPAGSEKKEIRFIKDVLMPEVAGSSTDEKTQHKNQEIAAARKELEKSVGDLTITIDDTEGGTDQLARRIKIAYVKPEEDEKRWGVERRAFEESKEVWKQLLNLLNKMCEFKVNNENNSKQPQKKVLSAQAVQWTSEMWKGASAPDIKMTENLLQQFFMLSKPSKDLQQINCSNEYPAGGVLSYPNGKFGEATKDNPDSCEAGSGEVVLPCARYKVLNKVATIIGTSRALHTYEAMKQISERFAKDPSTMQLTDRLFIELLGDGKIGELIDKNRDEWFSFGLLLAKYLQGQQGGGANFRPEANKSRSAYGSGGVGDSSGGGK